MQHRALEHNPLVHSAQLQTLHEGAWNWARFLLHSDADAADEVMQMVYVQIMEGKALYRGQASLNTWLYGVIRNTCRAHQRRQWLVGRRAAVEVEVDTLVNGAGLPETGHAEDEQIARRRLALGDAIAQLSARQREVIHLVIYRDFSLQQCADVLGMRVGSARTHYERAKARLKQQLAHVLTAEVEQ